MKGKAGLLALQSHFVFWGCWLYIRTFAVQSSFLVQGIMDCRRLLCCSPKLSSSQRWWTVVSLDRNVSVALRLHYRFIPDEENPVHSWVTGVL